MTEKRFTFDIDNENGYDEEPYFNNGTDSFYVNNADEMELFIKEINELTEENEELKSKYSEQCIQLDFLKDENQHMRDLVNKNEQLKEKNKELQKRNDRQYKRLDDLYKLIEEKNWKALSDIIDDFKKSEELLQKEWEGVFE